jgi:hypothetical protein
MALRPVNYKKVAKTAKKIEKSTDKANKAAAKTSTKRAIEVSGKKNVYSLREQRANAKSTLKTAALRSAVTKGMNAKDGDAPAWTKEGSRAGNRTLRSAVGLGRAKEMSADAGMKAKTARKIVAKTESAATKKINKANKNTRKNTTSY